MTITDAKLHSAKRTGEFLQISALAIIVLLITIIVGAMLGGGAREMVSDLAPFLVVSVAISCGMAVMGGVIRRR